MTVNDLKTFADCAMDFAIDHLRRTGRFRLMFHLMRRDGSIEIAAMGAAKTEEQADAIKNEMSRLIREKIKRDELDAVVMMSDVFTTKITHENMRIKARMGYNVEQAAAAGLCEKEEAIYIWLDSPNYERAVSQFYRRNGSDIELLERRIIYQTGDPAESQGRFAHFFNKEKAEAAS